MRLTLSEVRRIATDVARQQDPFLEVIAATPSEGKSAYTEVLFAMRGSRSEPYRLIIGVTRDTSEFECRLAVQQRLQQHLAKQQ